MDTVPETTTFSPPAWPTKLGNHWCPFCYSCFSFLILFDTSPTLWEAIFNLLGGCLRKDNEARVKLIYQEFCLVLIYVLSLKLQSSGGNTLLTPVFIIEVLDAFGVSPMLSLRFSLIGVPVHHYNHYYWGGKIIVRVTYSNFDHNAERWRAITAFPLAELFQLFVREWPGHGGGLLVSYHTDTMVMLIYAIKSGMLIRWECPYTAALIPMLSGKYKRILVELALMHSRECSTLLKRHLSICSFGNCPMLETSAEVAFQKKWWLNQFHA